MQMHTGDAGRLADRAARVEPTTRDEIETALRAKYEAGELDTGLFETGNCWVVMDSVDGVLTFQWFEEAVHLDAALA